MKARTFAAALALLLGAYAAHAAVRPEIARLLPPDAVTIGGFDIQALRGTPLFDKLVSRFPVDRDERLDRIFAAAGFDPKKDIHRVLASGEGEPGGPAKATLVIVEGRFDLEGQGSPLRALFNPIGEHGGFTLYETASDEGRAKDSTFAFLDAGTVVMGPRAQVHSAIDRWLQPSEPSKAALAAQAQRDAHVWAASLEPGKLLGPWIENVPGGGGPLRAIAGSMQSLAIRATALADAVHAEAAFLCGGADDARSLADAAQAMAAFGALTAQRDRPEIAELLGKLQIRQNEGETTLSIDLTEEQILSLRR